MATVLNARGVPLPFSGASVSHFSATNSGPRLYGSSRNDSMWGDSSVSVVMEAGSGDDFYYLYSSRNSAFERAGEGVDTINTWMSYTLPENFENLVVTGDGRYAFGNAENNIITGGSGRQTLDGGAGDDVLKGGSGADIFIVSKGKGSDLILDFGDSDQVRLEGYGFRSFDAVKSNMTQVGEDTRLDLGDGDILVFADTDIPELGVDQFKLSLDKSEMRLSFSDDFDTLSLRDGESGT
jgi:Ca2+-binding RTX toxin-like protein